MKLGLVYTICYENWAAGNEHRKGNLGLWHANEHQNWGRPPDYWTFTIMDYYYSCVILSYYYYGGSPEIIAVADCRVDVTNGLHGPMLYTNTGIEQKLAQK
jgi:hypothetical protein